MKNKTILEQCCEIAGQQGGTIHQFENELTIEQTGRLNGYRQWQIVFRSIPIAWCSQDRKPTVFNGGWFMHPIQGFVRPGFANDTNRPRYRFDENGNRHEIPAKNLAK